MTRAALVYDPKMAEYRFPEGHPMRPERFTLAVELMREWGLLEDPASPGALAPGGVARCAVLRPGAVTDEDLMLVHDPEYVSAVKAAGNIQYRANARFGLGYGDVPTFPDMHDASALAVGGTILALDAVLSGEALRTFNPAGGLHHAHRGRAAGFCIYNDAAVAIERAIRAHPGLRVAYVDVDAHHGDGVEEVFYDRADVLTVSVHESGRYLYPGTGESECIGEGEGYGFTLNVPLPPGAGPESYAIVLERVVAPALRTFGPDVVVAQLGADSHAADPLTHLVNTVEGYVRFVHGLVHLVNEVCGGRIAALGGGGYEPYSVVPRMWACAMAELMQAPVPSRLPEAWLARSTDAAGWANPPVVDTFAEVGYDAELPDSTTCVRLTEDAITRVRRMSPLLGGNPA